jgi:hypothetical protein
MGDAGIFKTGHQVWQRAHILAAANYLRDRLATMPGDLRLSSLYQGLLEVLDPARRIARVQRERLATTQASVPVKMERRARDRRSGGDRRKSDQGPPEGVERRSGIDRRTGKTRRKLG